jgi:hypothetical protein
MHNKKNKKVILYLPPWSWHPEIKKNGSELNSKGFTNAVIFMNNYYYDVIFYTREQIIIEINYQNYFYGEKGIFVVKDLDIETISNIIYVALLESFTFKNLFPYESFDLTDYHEVPLDIQLNEADYFKIH